MFTKNLFIVLLALIASFQLFAIEPINPDFLDNQQPTQIEGQQSHFLSAQIC